MLVNQLYTIIDILDLGNDTLLAKITLNKEHIVFKGHFPGHPVLPGVCLTNMITDVISHSQHKKYYLKSADFIKFITLVQPELTTNLSIKISKGEETQESIKAEAVIFIENTTFLKFKGLFQLL